MRLALLPLLLSQIICNARGINLTSFVDPLLASRGGGGFGGWGCQARNPGAMSPHPFLRLGPDTTRVDPVLGEVWSKLNRHAGYFGSDTHIRAFSLTHVQGAGDADLGTVGVMVSRSDAAGIARAAGVRPLSLPFPPLTLDRSPWATAFSHGDELASPGYYGVGLPNLNARAELTASGPRSGMHRYTCSSGGTAPGGSAPVNGPCTIVVDVCHRAHDQSCGGLSSLAYSIDSVSADLIIEGSHQDRGEFVRFNYSGLMIFFSMRLSAVDAASGQAVPAADLGTWSGYTATPNRANASVGPDLDSLGAYAVYPMRNGSSVTVTVRVGISAVSISGARANLVAEQGLQSFDDIRAAMDNTWETALSAAQVVLPADAALGVTDADALAAVDLGGASITDEDSSSLNGALSSFLDTPEGAAIALVEGWATLPGDFLSVINAARSARDAQLTGFDAPDRVLENLTRPRVNVTAAAVALRAGAAAVRAEATKARASSVDSDLEVFYSMFYIALCAPTTYSDADGTYRGFDDALHAADTSGARFMSDLSLWDTYRSHAVFLALVAPRALADIAGSLISMTRQGSMGMPRWPFASLYTEDMVGRHGVPLLADCVLVTGACAGRVSLADAAAAAISAISEQDDAALTYNQKNGWANFGPWSASATLEFALDDYAASALARATGNASVADSFGVLAGNWRSVFQASVPAVLPRLANGTFVDSPGIWNPHPFNTFYTEGNAAQWMWSVPHDMASLASAFDGGADEFSAVLQVILANQTLWTNAFATFLPNPYCWLGNEPSMLLPWSHAWAGPANAWRAQFWPRWHLRTYYAPSSEAIPGNDDYGALSSWAVFAYLGIYPVSPTGTFALGSPIFADARVAAPAVSAPFSGSGCVLHIVANNASAARIYVAAVRVNGLSLSQPFVTWAQLWPSGANQEATLEFDMVDAPTQWSARSTR
jgi:putative alpha-1,2-mannosidase